MNSRRSILASAAVVALAMCLPAVAPAQSWPAKPIRVIVPFPPAGGTDVLTRQLAEKISAATKWNLVIDNKPGAGGNIGLDALAKSAPDGYTIGMGQTANLAINPALYEKMPFDALRDFAPVGLVSAQPMVLVVAADSPYHSLADVVAAAKVKPDAVTMASAGSGTVGHLAGELFARKAGVKFLHIPYKGASPAVTDLLGHQVDIIFANTQSVMTLVAAGKLRALAVSSAQRIKPLPAVPTISESGYKGFEAVTWSGLVAPAGTPAGIIAKLNAEIAKALARSDFLEKLAAEGSQPLGGSPQQFAEFLRAEHAKWGVAVRASGAKVD
ncbi:MAG TPA: tripartite tricarboxylate transporter substrate binding protein [Burkholderiales bacterium]